MFIPIYHSKTLLSIIHSEIGFICIQVSVLIQENERMCLLAQSVLPPTFYDLTIEFRIFSDILIFKKNFHSIPIMKIATQYICSLLQSTITF